LSGRRISSQSRLESSHALQASGAAFVSISGLIYFSREAAPLLSRRFSFSICSSSVTPSFDFRAARLWFLSVFVSNRFSRSTPGVPITSPRFLGVDKLSSDISYRHHAVQVLSLSLGFSRRCSSVFVRRTILWFAWRAVPPVRFTSVSIRGSVPRFNRLSPILRWFVSVLLAAGFESGFPLVRLGFVSVSRSVPADHVPSPLLCLGHCLVRSREECPCAAGCTCGRARSSTARPRFLFNRAAECFISAGPISFWV
jgi:hypothetical protein